MIDDEQIRAAKEVVVEAAIAFVGDLASVTKKARLCYAVDELEKACSPPTALEVVERVRKMWGQFTEHPGTPPWRMQAYNELLNELLDTIEREIRKRGEEE